MASSANVGIGPPPNGPAGRIAPQLVIHGGAGAIRRENFGHIAAALAGLTEALEQGFRLLTGGSDAVTAAVAAVRSMEDSPEFNAGKGAVYTAVGTHELDAAVMDGYRLRAGAVACVHRVRNPIALAQAVMERSPHVLLAADGAEAFARDCHLAIVDATYFDTKARWEEWQRAVAASPNHINPSTHYGTVGAVAIDRDGHLAAATSTGGMTNKQPGRIGDTPVIGAGTYANASCAVSGTGWGEFFIRAAAAHAICMRVATMHEAVQSAADAVINHVIPGLGGNGGAIALGADGSVSTPFNTLGMFRGRIGGSAGPRPVVAVWPDGPP